MPVEVHRCQMPFNCDAVEFCDDRKRFLVATYELVMKSNNYRDGTLTLFDTSEKSFEVAAHIETPAGVLDIKFLPAAKDHFIMPQANGCVQLGRVTSDFMPSIELLASSKNEFGSDIALSVSCHTDRLISAAFSSGSLRTFKVTESGVKLLCQRKVHDYEAWSVLALDDAVLTGGDDCTLRSSDGNDSKVLRRFDAGVTAIERDVTEHGLLVGTYEEKLYKFDLRNMKTALLEADLSGGVWRIKSNPWDPRYIAIAGMYVGALIVDSDTFKILHHYDGHESMCYGVAWRDSGHIVSCSFYDKLVCLWETELND